MTPDTALNWSQLAPAVPEIWLGFAVCAILLAEVFTDDRRRGLISNLTLLALIIGAALTAAYGHVGQRTQLFDGMYEADELSYVLKLAGFLFLAAGLLYSRRYLATKSPVTKSYGVHFTTFAATVDSRYSSAP